MPYYVLTLHPSFLKKTRHWGRKGKRVCIKRLLEDLWSTSQNQLSHCTQNLLPLCALPHPQRKRQLSLRQKPYLEKKCSSWCLLYKLKESWKKLRLKLHCSISSNTCIRSECAYTKNILKANTVGAAFTLSTWDDYSSTECNLTEHTQQENHVWNATIILILRPK